jgi:hypothetical protein
MALLRINCRVCAKLGRVMQTHSIVQEFTNLPPNVVCVQCLGCGVMRIEMLLDSQVPTDEEILHD